MPIVAPGTIVQVEAGMTCRIQNYTSNAEVACVRTFIRPKYAGSKFLIEVNTPSNTSDSPGAQGSNSNPYGGIQIQREINGNGTFTNADYMGTDTSGLRINVHLETSPWRAGEDDGIGSWNAGRRYRMKPCNAKIIDVPNYSLGDYIVYRLFLQRRGGFHQFGAPFGFNTDNVYFNFHYGMIVHEIIQ